MKHWIIGSSLLSALIFLSCNGSQNPAETEQNKVDQEAMRKLEEATLEVNVGVRKLEMEINHVDAQVDSLLIGI